MKPSKGGFSTVIAFSFLSFAGCTPVVPRELADARAAYQHAMSSRAMDLSPAELHKAQQALAKAEEAFAADPDSMKTRDLSYVAQRKAQLAEALASIELSNRQTAAAGQSIQKSEHAIQKRTEGELMQTREQLAASESRGQAQGQALDTERQARVDADQRSADANARAKATQDALVNLAAVKEEERGMVITLPGRVLFASQEAILLPVAQTHLDQVADQLMTTRERNVIVEGFTDFNGSARLNLDLSQRRADAVRTYLMERGYESRRIRALGMGRRMTGNDTAAGRANNRRVDIIIEH